MRPAADQCILFQHDKSLAIPTARTSAGAEEVAVERCTGAELGMSDGLGAKPAAMAAVAAAAAA